MTAHPEVDNLGDCLQAYPCSQKVTSNRFGGAMKIIRRSIVPAFLGGIGLLTSLGFARADTVSSLDGLAGEVVGVVGSGDHLALRLRLAGQVQTLNLGDEYRDGWKLTALTPDRASLAKGVEIRQVGLNPSGEVADKQALSESGTEVAVIGRSSQDILRAALDSGDWDGKPIGKQTLEETELRISTMGRIALRLADLQSEMRSTGQDGFPALNAVEAKSLLGDDASRLEALIRRYSPGGIDGPIQLSFLLTNARPVWTSVTVVVEKPT